MSPATRRLPVALAGAALLVASACGSGSGTHANSASLSHASPMAELTAAANNLNNSSTVTATLHVGLTAQQLAAISRAGGGKALTPSQASLIAGSSIVIEAHAPSGTLAACSGTPDLSMTANIGGSPLVNLRKLGQTVYVQVQVQQILQLAHVSASRIQALQTRIPPQLTWARDALAGKWISINLTQLQAILGQLGGSGGQSGMPNPCQIVSQLRGAISGDFTVTRVSTGGANGDHLQITANLRKLATDTLTALHGVLPNIPTLTNRLNPTTIPDRSVTLDAYVQGNTLSSVSVDLAQFATGEQATQLAGQHLPITVDLSAGGAAIAAPSSSTPVDLAQIGSLIQPLLQGGATSQSTTQATP